MVTFTYFIVMFQLETLLNCCCKRKRFLSQLNSKRLGAYLLLSLRDNSAAQTALCLALEWNLLVEADQRLTIVTTLQSTKSGRQSYEDLCHRQLHLQELVSITHIHSHTKSIYIKLKV